MRTLFYYGPDDRLLPWLTSPERTKAANDRLTALLRQAVADGYTQFVTTLQTQSDRTFADIVLTLKRSVPAIQLHITLPQDSLPGDLPDGADHVTVSANPYQNEAIARLHNVTTALDSADHLLMPQEPSPRAPLSVQLARMALDRGIELTLYSDTDIQRVRPKHLTGEPTIQ